MCAYCVGGVHCFLPKKERLWLTKLKICFIKMCADCVTGVQCVLPKKETRKGLLGHKDLQKVLP